MFNNSFFIGIDVSKAVIDVSYYRAGQPNYLGQYLNSKKGFELFCADLSKITHQPTEQWFVCFENTGPYSKSLLYWLMDQNISCLEENPIKMSMSLGMRRGKNDKIDSRDICNYVFEKRDKITPTVLDKPLIIKLKSLLSRRDLLVKQKVGLMVSLKEQKSSMDKALYEELNDENETMIKYFEKQIRSLEARIQDVIQSDIKVAKNDELLQSIIGIGLITSAYLISTTNNFESIRDARKYACYCGIAPFPNSSGARKGKNKVNHMANKKIKSLLSNCIATAIVFDPEISLYYAKKKKEGKSYGVVGNAIKNKLIHRAFAVINRQTPYVKMMNYA